MRYVAFFDLDHTILEINSGEALLRRAYNNGILSVWRLIKAYCIAILYKLKLIDSSSIIEIIGSWLSKSTVNDIEKLCDEVVVKDLISAIRPEIISELKTHKEQGATLIILSSALSSICSRVASHLKMHSVICSELEVVNQQYTGRPIGRFCLKDEKLKRMNEYLHNNGYNSQDSFYYGDSIDDSPVLLSVGHPICVNPDKKLKKIAQENGWVVHSWNNTR